MKHPSIFICALTLALVAANAAPAQTLLPGASQFNPHPHRRHRPESRRPRSRSWMRRRARPCSRCRRVRSATASTIAWTKPPQPGSARAAARPIHAPAPIGEGLSQFLYWARNMRNESCGLSTSEMTRPSGPSTAMKLSVTARPGDHDMRSMKRLSILVGARVRAHPSRLSGATHSTSTFPD